MASNKGPVATEAPFVAPPAAAIALGAGELYAPPDISRSSSSLKRPREASPVSLAAAATGQLGNELSPGRKIQRLSFIASRQSPAPLTGASAEEEDRRLRAEEEGRSAQVSDSPSHRVLAALMSATQGLSRAQDAPAPATASLAAAAAASQAADNSAHVVVVDKPASPAANPSEHAPNADHAENTTSPQSAAESANNSYQVVHSPAEMDVEMEPLNEQPGSLVAQSSETPGQGDKNTAYSYPGIAPPPAPMAAPAAPQRGMSLPMSSSSQQQAELAPRSPSNNKKHKCQYCDTEFTRHHNLKSHLLTHSQEKPYICQTCQMRFRRLHDLKRHSKLHTGEKPHICPKCNRKFARGDALARHAKGAGGCAVRRASMGSFGGDEYDESINESDDTHMSGVMYDGNEAELTEEEQRRRLSLPTSKAHLVVAAPDGFGHVHASTFPQAGSRPDANHHHHRGVTESPRPPMSPGTALATQLGQNHAAGNANRQRSPSVTAQAAHQIFSRRQSDLASPHVATPPAPATGVAPPPNSSSSTTSNHLSGPPAAGAPSRPSSGPSHGPGGSAPSSGGGDNSTNLFASGDPGMWSYIYSLDNKHDAFNKQILERISSLETAKAAADAQVYHLDGRVQQLTEEVLFLRQQLTNRRNESTQPLPHRGGEAVVESPEPRATNSTTTHSAPSVVDTVSAAATSAAKD